MQLRYFVIGFLILAIGFVLGYGVRMVMKPVTTPQPAIQLPPADSAVPTPPPCNDKGIPCTPKPLSESQEEGTWYSGLGFSLLLPPGVTAGTVQQAEGGPYQYVQFSDGTVVYMTTDLEFDDKYGDFPKDGIPVTIGDNTFLTVKDGVRMQGGTGYGIEKDGVRYHIYKKVDSKIDLATFKIPPQYRGD